MIYYKWLPIYEWGVFYMDGVRIRRPKVSDLKELNIFLK